MDFYNGHPVLRGVPGPLITFVEGDGGYTVKIEIEYPGCPGKKAYILMGTYCCKYPSDTGKINPKKEYEKSEYDVLLIDESYVLFTAENYVYKTFYEEKKVGVKIVPTDIEFTVEETIAAIDKAVENYKKHPIKPKGRFLRRLDSVDRKMACPLLMINPHEMPELIGNWD